MVNEEEELTVDRTSKDGLWMKVVSFYKSASLHPHKLHEVLTVEYSREASANSGSLRRDDDSLSLIPQRQAQEQELERFCLPVDCLSIAIVKSRTWRCVCWATTIMW